MKAVLRFIQHTKSVYALLCIFTFSCFAAPNAETTSSTNTKLNEVKAEISQTKSALNSVNKKRSQLEKQLKENDLAIANVIQKIQQNNKNKDTLEEKLAELKKNKKSLLSNKKKQEKLLAKQLRAAYSAGHHDYIKLLLNQENPALIQRTITQYQYINNARISEIENFKKIIAELLALEEEQKTQSLALNKVTLTLASDKKSLEANKQQRSQTLKQLKKESTN